MRHKIILRLFALVNIVAAVTAMVIAIHPLDYGTMPYEVGVKIVSVVWFISFVMSIAEGVLKDDAKVWWRLSVVWNTVPFTLVVFNSFANNNPWASYLAFYAFAMNIGLSLGESFLTNKSKPEFTKDQSVENAAK